MNHQEPKPLRLHLGCGEIYLKGYFNIDYPQAQHSIVNIQADQYTEIRSLVYPEGTVDEIRHHHVLEHFPRTEALALLINWRRWLKIGGLLVIETPDFEESSRDFLNAPFKKKGLYLRHIFGSNEAAWAIHYDGWFEEKYRSILGKLGFEVVKIVKMRNNLAKRVDYQLNTIFDAIAKLTPSAIKDAIGINVIPNILCVARKTSQDVSELKVAEEILSSYLIGKEKENQDILRVWMEDLKKVVKISNG
ncbi:MAG: hypothetical protein HY093_04170 [Candidatus Liptonbacteria bacterium]|nr:hypothetical protein [Candidatus Liptonbacteria bacterium]